MLTGRDPLTLYVLVQFYSNIHTDKCNEWYDIVEYYLHPKIQTYTSEIMNLAIGSETKYPWEVLYFSKRVNKWTEVLSEGVAALCEKAQRHNRNQMMTLLGMILMK